MRTKRKSLYVLLAAAIMGLTAFADEADNRYLQSDPRTEADVPRTEVVGQPVSGRAEQISPQLEPGLAQIEEQYRGRMQAIEAQLDMAATEAERNAIQQRAQELKVEWTLALANRQLELARERDDTDTEAEILQGIDRIVNPPPVQHDAQPRHDEEKSSEGGAR